MYISHYQSDLILRPYWQRCFRKNSSNKTTEQTYANREPWRQADHFHQIISFSFLTRVYAIRDNFSLIFIPHSLNYKHPTIKANFPFRQYLLMSFQSLLYITPLLYLTTNVKSNLNISFVCKNQYMLTRLLQFEFNRFVYRIVLVNAFVKISSTALFHRASELQVDDNSI
jgi:hypothetical protein